MVGRAGLFFDDALEDSGSLCWLAHDFYEIFLESFVLRVILARQTEMTRRNRKKMDGTE